MHSRYYDPATCRFINADAFVSTGQGIVGYNVFAYCLNNPVNLVDCDGCWAFLLDIANGGICDVINSILEHIEEAEESITDSIIAYAEHHKRGTTNSSNRGKHEKGQARKKRDKGGEKGDVRRTPNPNKRSNITEPQVDSRLYGGLLLFGSAIGIIYIIANDATGVGIADDAELIPAFESLRYGYSLLFG